jgi:phosphotriesterase-related protein
MLSHDSVECWRGRDTGVLNGMIAASPNWNMAHISRNILPAMRKAGVSQETIDTLMVKNPCSYFGAAKPRPRARRRKS